MFGYTKAKNWVLLADYLDGSRMHNYSALTFAQLVRGEGSFSPTPIHVNVILNGIDIGLYVFCEHIDEKEGRINIEQKNVWEKSFDETNFYIERNMRADSEEGAIENETYFIVNTNNYYIDHYKFELKYPEKEDFCEVLEDGSINTHDNEFRIFFNSLVNYITNICNKFTMYYNSFNCYSEINDIVDIESLALFGVIDQFVCENDHWGVSFKMYRDGGKLKFGPSWDYDSCSFGFYYLGTYVTNPYSVGTDLFQSTSFGEKWSYLLYEDLANGRLLYKAIWDSLSPEALENYLANQLEEIKKISYKLMYDTNIWMDNNYYSAFDNITYLYTYLNSHIDYLKNVIYA